MLLEKLLGGGIADLLGKMIDKVFPDPAERDRVKLALQTQEGRQALDEMNVQLSGILAEANSADPWTSRARPAFMYVIYIYVLAAIPMGVIFAFAPTTGQLVAEGVRAWLDSIPDDLWWLFGAGYLGYTGIRGFEKMRGVAR